MKKACVFAGLFFVAGVSQAIQTAGSLLVDLSTANLSGLTNNATVSVWTNAGASAGWFLPVTNGVGPVYSNNVAGVPAVVFSGTVSSVMTNTVTPSASICGANDWSFEVWVHNPALATTEDVFAWTGRNMWPGGTANGSCLEFRFGTDVANAVEHYGVNVPWGGNAPAANAWHHVAVTRDAAGTERLYLDGLLRTFYAPAALNIRSDSSYTLGGVRDFAFTNSASSWANFFSGSVAKLRIHDGTLSANAVVSNYLEERGAFGVTAVADSVWQGAAGSELPWSDSANWLGGLTGTNGTRVVIDNGGTAVHSSGTVALSRFFPNKGGLVVSNGASLTVPAAAGANVYMGYPSSNAFSFVLNEGTFAMPGTANNYLYLGNGLGGSATATVGGGTLPSLMDIDKDIVLAASSNSVGRMTMNAGAAVYISNGWFYVGSAFGADAKLTVNGGILSHRLTGCDVVVGANGARGVLEINGGSVSPSRNLVWAPGTGYASGYAAVQLNGGVLSAYQLTPSTTTGTNVLFLNGGTLRSRDSRPDYLQNLRGAYVQSGGAVFDVPTNTVVTAAQPLLADPASAGGGLTKFGTGALILSGSNTFTGNITVNAGDLLLRNASGLVAGYAGTISLSNNASIGLEKSGAVATLLARIPPDMQGSLTLFSANASENVDFSSRPNMGLGFYGSVIYTGTFTPYLNRYVFAPLSTGNIYTQAIASGSVTVNGSTNGVIELTANNSYTGGTVINGGMLIMSHTNALGFSLGTPDIVISNGATLKLNAAGVASNFAQRITADSKGFILLGAACANVSLDLTGRSGLIVGTDQNVLNYTGTLLPASDTYRVGGGKTPFRVSDKQGLVLNNLTNGPGATARQVVVEYDGVVRLAAGNTYSGGTVVTNNGAIFLLEDGLGAVPASPAASNIYVNSGAIRSASANFSLNANRGLAVGPLGMELHPWSGYTMTVLGDLSGSGGIFTTDGGSVFFGGTNNTWGGTLDIRQGTIGAGSGNAFSWNRNAVIGGNGGNFGVNRNSDFKWTDAFASPLGTGGANVGLRKLGTGKLTVDVTPTYTRDTAIEGGALKAGTLGAVPSGTGKGNVAISANAQLDVGGLNLSVNGLSGAGSVTDSAGTATVLTAGLNNATATFSGAVAPSLLFVKTGTGTQTLGSGAALKDVRVEQGTLLMTNAVAPTGTVTLAAAGILRVLGNGVLPASRFFSLTGVTGSLLVIDTNATVEIVSQQDSTFGGSIIGTNKPATFVKSGAGKLTLTSAGSTFVGQTRVDSGTLALSSAGTLGPVELVTSAALTVTGMSSGLPFPYSTTSGTGLPGAYYNITPPNPHTAFYTQSAYESYLSTNTPSLIAGSDLAGTTFDFGSTGTKFPAPYNSGSAANFQVFWKGQIELPVSGSYTFYTSSDDGSMLFIDGAGVVTNNAFQGVTEKSGTLTLTAGTHAIAIGFYQGTGGYGMYADILIPGGSKQRIPNSMLRPSTSNIGALSGAGSASLLNDGALLRIDEQVNSTYAGGAAGPTNSGIVKAGSQTLMLTGNNDAFFGTWYLSAGMLQVGNGGTAGTLGGTSVATSTNAVLAFNRSDNVSYPGVITGNGEIRSLGAGTVILSGSLASYGGAIKIATGQAIKLTRSLSGAATVTNNGTLSLAGGAFLTDGARIGGTGTTLLQDGAQLYLTNALAFPNSVAIGGGELALPVTGNTLSNLTVKAGAASELSLGVTSNSQTWAVNRLTLETGSLLQVGAYGLWGKYYDEVPADVTFATLAAFTNYFASKTVQLTASSNLRGYSFDFGSDGAGTNGTAFFPGKYFSVPGNKTSNFSAIWQGKIKIDLAGTYTFGITSDDNSMLFINGSQVATNNSAHAMQLRSGSVALTNGLHDIAILFAQQGGGYGLYVDITLPGETVSRRLPNSMLVPEKANTPAYTLDVATLAVTNGAGTAAVSLDNSGTLRLKDLWVDTGAVLAVTGKVAVAGNSLTVTVPHELPRGPTLVGDFTATDGLSLSGVTLTAIGSDGKVVYRNKKLYLSRPMGTVLVVR